MFLVHQRLMREMEGKNVNNVLVFSLLLRKPKVTEGGIDIAHTVTEIEFFVHVFKLEDNQNAKKGNSHTELNGIIGFIMRKLCPSDDRWTTSREILENRDLVGNLKATGEIGGN